MKSRWLLFALIWIPFVSLFVFAAPIWGGDTYSHVAFHVFALVLLVKACREVWSARSDAPTRAQRVLTWSLSVTVPLAVVGHAIELVTAVVRLVDEGWANAETEDIFTDGSHALAANLTVPMMMLSMLAVLTLVVVTAAQRTRGVEPADADTYIRHRGRADRPPAARP